MFIGSVYAAAVILPPDFHNEDLNDSKQLSEKKRYALRPIIEREAIAWAVGIVTPEEIDRINILKASFLAMHRAIDQLKVKPEHPVDRREPLSPLSRSQTYDCRKKETANI